jgi:hypothetical protein
VANTRITSKKKFRINLAFTDKVKSYLLALEITLI